MRLPLPTRWFRQREHAVLSERRARFFRLFRRWVLLKAVAVVVVLLAVSTDIGREKWDEAADAADRMWHGAPECPAAEPVPGTDPPLVEVLGGSNPDEFVVHTDRALCAVVSFDVSLSLDLHAISHFNHPYDHWRKEYLNVAIPTGTAYTAVAVGPGGTQTISGEFRVEAG